MSVSFAIDAFYTTLAVRRYTEAVTFTDGIAQTVTEVNEFDIVGASFQPMNARERMLMPELIRDRELSKCYTKCELLSVDVVGKKLADRVTYREENYIVQSVEDWAPHGDFWKVTLVKEND